MNLMKSLTTGTLFAIGLLILSGCATTNATYIDSAGTDTIVSVDQINIQDWTLAAEEMIASLLSSGVLERAPEQPAVLVISRVVNDTTEQVDTDLLTKKIRVALSQSGKVVTTTTMGYGGAEDPMAKGLADKRAFMDEDAPKAPDPYFSLSGKLLENRARAGNTRQVSYVFQLSLTETNTGLAMWEDEKTITKQGKKASVGW